MSYLILGLVHLQLKPDQRLGVVLKSLGSKKEPAGLEWAQGEIQCGLVEV